MKARALRSMLWLTVVVPVFGLSLPMVANAGKSSQDYTQENVEKLLSKNAELVAERQRGPDQKAAERQREAVKKAAEQRRETR